MPKLHRGSAAPPGALRDVRNTRLYGSADEQIEAFAERARGCPDPERAVIYTRRPRTSRARVSGSTPVVTDSTPAQHARNVALLERNWLACCTRVKALRAEGKPHDEAAARARELRHALLALTGGIERREIEVDQGSAVNPMVAV